MNKIDLSPLIGSQVLCEFSNYISPDTCYSFLKGAVYDPSGQEPPEFVDSLYEQVFDTCRIYSHPDYWIANPNHDLALPNGLICKALFVSFQGERYVVLGEIKGGNLYFDGEVYDVPLNKCEAVQVIGPADGWEW